MRLLEAADSAGLVPHLLTTDPGEDGSARMLRERGWTIEVLPDPHPSILARLRQQARRLPSPFIPAVDARLRELAGTAKTLVQIEHIQSAYYGRALRGAPWVLSLHNVDSEMIHSIARTQRPGTAAWLRAWNQWQATRSVERREVVNASGVLCVSERDRDRLAAPGAEIVVAPNGIDDEFFSTDPTGGEDGRVLFFGRIDYPPNEHGLTKFLRESWPQVHASAPEARLRVVGHGASEDLKALAEATPGVEFVGFVEDLVSEVEASCLTVVPLWAGGGTRLKVLESMAAARPVVGTALGVEGVGFEPDRHGLIADTTEGLARGIVELLRHPEQRRQMGLASREHAERYRWSRTTAPAVALYRQLLERTG